MSRMTCQNGFVFIAAIWLGLTVISARGGGLVSRASPALSTETPTVTLLSNDPALTDPYGLTTDGTRFFVGNSNSIFSLPIGGGAVTMLYSNCTPIDPVSDMTSIGTNLYWIDPNGDPDATAIFSAPTSGGTITKIYSGFAEGQTIVDGASITTDGIKLYASDDVQGRIDSLNPDGTDINLFASRYDGFFELEHYNSITESEGLLYVADDGSMAMSGIPPQVVSIPTNGGAFTTLYSGAPFVHLQGIAVGGGMVYVADPGASNTIWQLPISGGTPKVLVSGAPFVSIVRLLFFNDALYITDTGNVGTTNAPGAIYKIDHLPYFSPSTGVVADYDGDGLADPAIYDEDTGIWKILLSSANYQQVTTTFDGLGGPGLGSVSADYDGDGFADPAVYSESSGVWTILESSLNYAAWIFPQTLGGPGYSGMPADYDGDSLADPCVYQRERGDWKLLLSSAGYYPVALSGFLGGTRYLPVAADYDGDMKADPAIYGEDTGIWEINLSSANYETVVLPQFLGGSGFIPVPADYDGDGLADPAIKLDPGNDWFVVFSSSGNYDLPVHFKILFE